MAQKKQINWEVIELEYKAGQLSIREIARQYGCSHTAVQLHAQKYGLKRDLTKRVRREVARKVAKRVANLNAEATEDEIVDTYSTRGAEVVDLQRKDVADLRTLEKKLIDELQGNPKKVWVGQYRGKIVEREYELTAAERAQAANNLANVQHKRIQLERQAFNLDATAGDDDAPESIRVTYYKKP